MSDKRHRVLHIGGNAADALLIRDTLTASTSDGYEIEWVGTLADGLERLAAGPTSAVLLDLRLPDCADLEGLRRLLRAAPSVPIIAVGADQDGEMARQVVAAGAYDYLLTNHLDSYWLPRALRHAIAQKLSENGYVAEAERLEVTLNAIEDALFNTDTAGRITYLNRTAAAITGWTRADAAGRPLTEVLQVIDSATREPASASLEGAIPGDPTTSLVKNCILVRRDGSESAIEQSTVPIRDTFGAVNGAAIVVRDVSPARAMSLRMAHLASHDALTDLPNRLLLDDRLARALALAHRHHRRLAVLFLDIDRFKDINDSLGHAVGDELLRTVARALTLCVRSSDTVSRHGGDEFVVLLSELNGAEDAAVGARKIMAAVAQARLLADDELRVTLSIGISVYPDDGPDAETLLKNADMALYRAKEQGRDRYQFFERDLNVRAVERQSIEAALRQALDKREFELHYQPRVHLKTGAIVGAEALVRWRHPNRGLVEPGQFLRIAADCGQIGHIGRWVIHEACRQAQAWQAADLSPIPVSVNISAVEFRSMGFLKSIDDILKATSLHPRYLELEITEGVLLAYGEAATSALHALKGLGIQLTLDNFGTGWSSLSYLRRFSIDALKIDRSFIQEIRSDSNVAGLIGSIIGLGKSLNLRVIAEGVETRDQLTLLLAEDCDEGQGYYYSRPLGAQQFAELLESVSAYAVRSVDAPPTTKGTATVRRGTSSTTAESPDDVSQLPARPNAPALNEKYSGVLFRASRKR